MSAGSSCGGTGIGLSISANKVPGIRAALCHDNYSAERARKSNNAQIITLGARVIGPELAKSIVTSWLASEFEAGPLGAEGLNASSIMITNFIMMPAIADSVIIRRDAVIWPHVQRRRAFHYKNPVNVINDKYGVNTFGP